MIPTTRRRPSSVLWLAPVVIASILGSWTEASAEAKFGGTGGHLDPRPWWRVPKIYTVQEEFFLSWMDAIYGPDWLRWMHDSQIGRHWQLFLDHWGTC